MTDYRIGIVAHTKRAQQAHTLMDQVGAAYLTMDNGKLGCDANHRKAWTYHANHTRTPWAVVLEDDTEIEDDFNTQLAQALTHAPTPIVSLYLGTSRPPQHQPSIKRATQQATATGAAWITSKHLLHAVAVAIHTNLIPHMLDHLNPALPIDEAITHWATRNQHSVAYTWPSIVDHTDGPTLINHRDRQPRTQPRKAWAHGTPQWNHNAVPMGN